MLDDRNDFGFIIDIWMHALNATWHQPPGRGLVLWVYAVQPFGKLASYPEACCPRSGTGRGQTLEPAHAQVGVDVLHVIAVGEEGEATQYSLIRAQIGAELSPDGQVAVKFSKEAHRATSATGQGWAMERRPSVSSFA